MIKCGYRYIGLVICKDNTDDLESAVDFFLVHFRQITRRIISLGHTASFQQSPVKFQKELSDMLQEECTLIVKLTY